MLGTYRRQLQAGIFRWNVLMVRDENKWAMVNVCGLCWANNFIVYVMPHHHAPSVACYVRDPVQVHSKATEHRNLCFMLPYSVISCIIRHTSNPRWEAPSYVCCAILVNPPITPCVKLLKPTNTCTYIALLYLGMTLDGMAGWCSFLSFKQYFTCMCGHDIKGDNV